MSGWPWMRCVAPEAVFISLLALIVSASLTRAVRSLSWAHGLLDVPNERSSHSATTPRGGGVAIVIACTLALLLLRWIDAMGTGLLAALIGGGSVVAVVGFLDDQYRVRAGIRLAVHILAALWALKCLGGLPLVQIGHRLVDLGWGGQGLALVGIVWVLNLFNFMDGIDGIAASEAVFIAVGGALLGLVYASASGGAASGVATTGVAAAGLAVGAASLGFLLWNWPPATIFMGDVGSGYLGYLIAALALAATRANPAAVWIWLTLGGVFFVDATVTVVRRALRRERLHQAHRGHAYQRLAQRWGSHRRVTLAVILLNLVWLLPCALLAALVPRAAFWIVFGALAPLVVLALVLGSGAQNYGSRNNGS
jgi:Fuc2NAc and GlcNAc transferase